MTLSPTDNLAGIAKTLFKLDDGDWTEGTSVEVPVVEGEHTILYYSKDAASPANVEDTKTAKVFIDTTAPTTTDNAPAGYQSEAVTVTLSPTDNLAGVAKTLFKLDDGDWTEGTSVEVPVVEGEHTILYYSKDAASPANVEDTKTAKVFIDTTAPTTTDNAPAGYQSEAVTVTLSPTDNLAGVAKTLFKLDDGDWTEGTSVEVPVVEGEHTILYYSKDAASPANVEDTKTAKVFIDTTAPTTTDNAPAGYQSEAVTVTLSPTDNLAGVAKTLFKLDDGDWTEGTSVEVPVVEGEHTILYYSKDAASPANVEDTKTAKVFIDTTAPTTTDNARPATRARPSR